MDKPAIRKLTPNRFDPDTFRVEDVSFRYISDADIMYMYFSPGRRAGVRILVDPSEDIYIIVDPETEDVVGVQMDHYITHLVYSWPEVIPLGFFAGIDPKKMSKVLQRAAQQNESVTEGDKWVLMRPALERLFGSSETGRRLMPA